MPYPTKKWDLIPVFGVYMTAPGDAAVQGSVQFKISQRITRTDGRTIYPDGATVKVTIGLSDEQDSTVRAAVRTAWRAFDQTAEGAGFDGSAWDIWWDTKVLPAAIFTGFPAADDPDISQRDWAVTVKESLTNAAGKEYAIQPLLAHLLTSIPGINLGAIDVPPGSPSVAAPVYAKGVAGGIAALDVDGDVVDAAGDKVTGAVASVAGRTGAVSLAKADVGLSNVDNTADASKPVSSATQTALNLKANLASPAFTGTPTGLLKAHVGLGSVDNTADTAKPVSTAQQTALNLKANLASPTFTGMVSGVTKTHVGLANVDNTSDATKLAAFLAALPTQVYVFTWSGGAWQYKGVTVTALPAGFRANCDLAQFVGNPGATSFDVPWAPVNYTLWNQG